MTPLSPRRPPVDPHDLARAVFEGEILVFRQLEPLRQLAAATRERTRQAFDGSDPRTVHETITPQAFGATAAALRRAFAQDPAVRKLVSASFAGLGLEPNRLYADRLALRIVPGRAGHADRRARLLPPHRDSWGSNLLQQINWWTPIFPVDRRNTLVIYPAYWTRPVANDSADWDLEALRRGRGAGEAKSYPRLPTAREPIDAADGLAIVVDPGDLVAFSAAHLHGSAPAYSGQGRVSAEFRTVDPQDIIAGRGAPNLDGRAPRRPYGWFARLSDGRSLADWAERWNGSGT